MREARPDGLPEPGVLVPEPFRGRRRLAFDRLNAVAHPTLTTDVASEYAERLASLLGEDLLRVSLFGSRARGEAGPRSDFDLMVVLRRASGASRDVVHGLATEIELEHGIDLSTKITDEERFERPRRSALPFWRHFNRDEEVLWPPMSSPRDERENGDYSVFPAISEEEAERAVESAPRFVEAMEEFLQREGFETRG